jgi:hypothetical protein
MGAPGSVRVTVASRTRRVDLVLPGAVPVAELVPELARSVGLLEPGTVSDGHRLVTTGGRVLAGDTGLIRQGHRGRRGPDRGPRRWRTASTPLRRRRRGDGRRRRS